MKLLIDKIKLKLLLEEKRDYIKHPVDGLDIVITAVLYMVSLLCSDFKSVFGIPALVLTTLAWVLAVGLLFFGCYKVHRSKKYRYDHTMLFTEIENLNEVLHRLSIVAVKDGFQEFSNRFLLYYDQTWKCWFFFSFHTVDQQNDGSVIQRLSNCLKVDRADIRLRYVSDRIQPKFSERDQIHKVYQHSLYQADIIRFPEFLRRDSFCLEGIQYKWWTITEMEADPELMEKNGDVISFVKEKIA